MSQLGLGSKKKSNISSNSHIDKLLSTKNNIKILTKEISILENENNELSDKIKEFDNSIMKDKLLTSRNINKIFLTKLKHCIDTDKFDIDLNDEFFKKNYNTIIKIYNDSNNNISNNVKKDVYSYAKSKIDCFNYTNIL